MWGMISNQVATCGQLRTAERVAKWRTRPPDTTQAPGRHGVATAVRVSHSAPRVANSPPPLRWPRMRQPLDEPAGPARSPLAGPAGRAHFFTVRLTGGAVRVTTPNFS